VAVFLGEMVAKYDSRFWLAACYLLHDHHVPADYEGGGLKVTSKAVAWWKENEADLRRRANQLPR
jgi:hypothetical protein